MLKGCAHFRLVGRGVGVLTYFYDKCKQGVSVEEDGGGK